MTATRAEKEESYPFADTSDFDDADRGWLAGLDPPVVTASDGRRVWDLERYAFLGGERPDTVDASLWRQSQLCVKHGLYEVTEGVYQVRGLDLSNMSLLEGDRGVIVVDPLISTETAAAALALYRKFRGDRPVTGVVYTHPHADHFGGVLGVVDPDTDVPILAPEGFLEHAVSENVYAGTAMTRRSAYMYGANLDTSPTGQVGVGLGMGTSSGSFGLIPPGRDITRTGQEETVDGVRLVFQLTPGTEAPAEMNFLLPDRRALCMAENATHNLHNLLTLRGALVRDAHVWAHYLTESIKLFADRADVVFASHHWPTWGRERIATFLSQQRDLYAYLHDQTVRLLNQGLTGTEIAETIELPPGLRNAWNTHGYYGSVSHNVKAIYQRYLGWYDGNPAHLWNHPPEAAARRYVEAFGKDAIVDKARGYAEAGDLRFAAELLNHVVFADPGDATAKELLAEVYERLGYGSENATWRSIYLTGAGELRHGAKPMPLTLGSPSMQAALTVEQILDSIAIRVDGPRAWNEHLTIDWTLTDTGHTHRTTLSNGVLIQERDPNGGSADLTLTLSKTRLLEMLRDGSLDGVEHKGDAGALRKLLGLLDQPDPGFPIVTP